MTSLSTRPLWILSHRANRAVVTWSRHGRAGRGRATHTYPRRRQLRVAHALTPEDLSERLVAALPRPSRTPTSVRTNSNSTMVGLVRSTVHGALEAWTVYYRNSLNELLDGTADFAPIHEKAEQLVRGSVLDLGSCFGFLPLRLARAGFGPSSQPTSSPGTMHCSTPWHPDRTRIGTLVCDAAEYRFPTTARTPSPRSTCSSTSTKTSGPQCYPRPSALPATGLSRRPLRGRGNGLSRTHPHLRHPSLTKLGESTGSPVRGVRTPRRLARHRRLTTS